MGKVLLKTKGVIFEQTYPVSRGSAIWMHTEDISIPLANLYDEDENLYSYYYQNLTEEVRLYHLDDKEFDDLDDFCLTRQQASNQTN